ncbi:MAG: acetyl-CoA hydrolase, partial [Muribaculaceae bacterium]
MAIPFISAQEAAEHIKNGDNVGFSGFTAAGTPKVVPVALADVARKEHEAGRPFKINIFSGASTNDFIDGELSRANAINMRTPYQSNNDMR